MLSRKSAPVALHACAASMLLFAGYAAANPTGPQVVNGQATFQTQGNQLTVANSPGAIINWQSFSIGQGQSTQFNQQSASSAVLNRVVGADVSQILGTLTSNGKVFLVNPNGILFGAASRVDTASFTATTGNLSNADFLAGRYDVTGQSAFLNIENGVLSGEIRLSGNTIDVTGTLSLGNATLTLRGDNANLLIPAGPFPGPGSSIQICPSGTGGCGSALPAVNSTVVISSPLPPTNTGAVQTGSGDITIGGGRITTTPGTSASAPTLVSSPATITLNGGGATTAGTSTITNSASRTITAPTIVAALGSVALGVNTVTLATAPSANPPAVIAAPVTSVAPAARSAAGVATISLQKREPLF